MRAPRKTAETLEGQEGLGARQDTAGETARRARARSSATRSDKRLRQAKRAGEGQAMRKAAEANSVRQSLTTPLSSRSKRRSPLAKIRLEWQVMRLRLIRAVPPCGRKI